jgi:hypothetical protein
VTQERAWGLGFNRWLLIGGRFGRWFFSTLTLILGGLGLGLGYEEAEFVRKEQLKVWHAVQGKGKNQKPDEIMIAGSECRERGAIAFSFHL